MLVKWAERCWIWFLYQGHAGPMSLLLVKHYHVILLYASVAVR
jgi:hypothetical protein